MSKNVICKITQEAKSGKLETVDLFIKNVKVTYAKLAQVETNFAKSGKEYSLNAFIDEETKEALEDLGVNKSFAEVGKAKKKKGANRGQLVYDPSTEVYEGFKGLYGFKLTLPELTKAGKRNVLVVKDRSTGGDFDFDKSLVGNGSVVTVKCFGYRTSDGDLNVQMKVVVVEELVEYQLEGGEGSYFDEELGMMIDTKPKEETAKVDDGENYEESSDEDSEDEPPFDTDEDDDIYN